MRTMSRRNTQDGQKTEESQDDKGYKYNIKFGSLLREPFQRYNEVRKGYKYNII
jgi:hypothetical protein